MKTNVAILAALLLISISFANQYVPGNSYQCPGYGAASCDLAPNCYWYETESGGYCRTISGWDTSDGLVFYIVQAAATPLLQYLFFIALLAVLFAAPSGDLGSRAVVASFINGIIALILGSLIVIDPGVWILVLASCVVSIFYAALSKKGWS